MEFPVETFMTVFFGIAAILVLFLTFASGALLATATIHLGPTKCHLATGALGLVFAFLYWLVGDVISNFQSPTIPWMAAVLGWGLHLLPASLMSLDGATYRKLCAEAPAIAADGLRLFDRLDQNADGLVNQYDLESAPSMQSFSERDLQVIEHLKSELEEVGHVIDRVSTTVLTPIPMATGGMILLPNQQSRNVYGISRDDLKTYAERRRKKWKAWLD